MKINKVTVIRTVILFISIINVVLKMFGINAIPIDNELVSEAISVAFLLYASISSWWHNNSFSKAALQADEYMKQLKGKK